MYRHAIAALLALFVLGAACQATRVALQPPLELLVIPGAADVQATATGWEAWQIAYRAPGPPYAWYYALAQRLEMRGWTALDSWHPGKTDSVYNPIIPLRFQRVYFGFVEDEIVLVPDDRWPKVARITVRRWLLLHWRPES